MKGSPLSIPRRQFVAHEPTLQGKSMRHCGTSYPVPHPLRSNNTLLPGVPQRGNSKKMNKNSDHRSFERPTHPHRSDGEPRQPANASRHYRPKLLLKTVEPNDPSWQELRVPPLSILRTPLPRANIPRVSRRDPESIGSFLTF